MRSLVLLFVCLVVAFACPAYAQNTKSVRPYLSAKAGFGGVGIVDIENETNVPDPATVSDDDTSDSAYVLGAAFGIEFLTFNRLEFEFMYRGGMEYNPNPTFTNAAIETSLESDISNKTFMINYIREIGREEWMVRPFVMAGLGLSINTTDSTLTVTSTGEEFSDEKTNSDLAWSIGGGAAFNFTEHIGLDLGVRYVDLGEVKWGDEDTIELVGDMGVVEGLAAFRYVF